MDSLHKPWQLVKDQMVRVSFLLCAAPFLSIELSRKEVHRMYQSPRRGLC